MWLDRLHRVPRSAWTIIVGLFFVGVGNYMVVPFFALYLTRDLHFSAVDVGVVLAVRLWTQRGMSIVGGILADRVGGRNVMVLGLLLRSIAYVGLAFAHSFPLVLCSTALLGLGAAFYTPAGKAALARLASPDNRLFILSMRNTASNVGIALGPPIGLLVGAWSYRGGLCITASLFLIFAGLTLFTVRAGDAGGSSGRPTPLRELGGALNRRLWTLAGVTALYFAMQVQIELTMPLFAGEHFSPTAVSLIFTVNAITVFVLQLPLSSWAERISSPLALTLGLAVTGGGFFLLAAPGGLGVFLFGVFVFTLGEIVVLPRVDDEVGRLLSPSMLGASFGFLGVAASIGGSIGNYGGGRLFEWARQSKTVNLLWMPLGAVACLSAVALYGPLRRILSPGKEPCPSDE